MVAVVVVVLALTAKYAQQGLRNGTVYVRPSVCLSQLSLAGAVDNKVKLNICLKQRRQRFCNTPTTSTVIHSVQFE